MASTYGPEVVIDLPSGADYAQKLTSVMGLEPNHHLTFYREQPSDADRKVIEDAIREATGDAIVFDGMEVQRINHGGARLEIKVVLGGDDGG